MRPTILILSAIALAGCGGGRPLHKGPDIAHVPEGFIYEGHLESGRNLFPGRSKTLQRGYTTAEFMTHDYSTITITQYAGPTAREHVEAALELERQHYGPHATISDIETLQINRQDAWAWSIREPGDRWSEGALTYRAVVTYPNESYLVEFYTSHKKFMDPNRMRTVVASFEVND